MSLPVDHENYHFILVCSDQSESLNTEEEEPVDQEVESESNAKGVWFFYSCNRILFL